MTNAVLKVELDGTNAGSARGLLIEAGGSDSVVKGLVINRFKLAGVGMDPDSTQNRVEGNFIGTDSGGTLDEGNADAGVNILDSTFNTIGGNPPISATSSGNSSDGVLITGRSRTSTLNRVEGNLIGTKKDGSTALGNRLGGGVFISGAPNTTVSGDTIAFNGQAGVAILAANNSANGNLLLGNSIFSNGQLGIDLGDDGVTQNDSLDKDTGPNDLQNFPVISSAKTSKKGTTITSTLN